MGTNLLRQLEVARKHSTTLEGMAIRMLNAMNEKDRVAYENELLEAEVRKAKDRFNQLIAATVARFGPFTLTEGDQREAYRAAVRAEIDVDETKTRSTFRLNPDVPLREIPPEEDAKAAIRPPVMPARPDPPSRLQRWAWRVLGLVPISPVLPAPAAPQAGPAAVPGPEAPGPGTSPDKPAGGQTEDETAQALRLVRDAVDPDANTEGVPV